MIPRAFFPRTIMQRLNIPSCKASFGLRSHLVEQHGTRIPSTVAPKSDVRSDFRALIVTEKVWLTKTSRKRIFQLGKIKSMVDENQGNEDEEDDDLCPVDCVREFKTDEEFLRILEKAKETNALVVVDFYRTSCGSCKYIEQGFSKLCKGAGDEEAAVIFLKHNVIDEYDEESEVAERLRIRSVPLFHFYKNGVLLEAFPTRDKERIDQAILKYTATPSPNS